MTTDPKITKDHRTRARRWALAQPTRPPAEAERAYAEGIATAEGSGESVLPAYFDDGGSMVVSSMSGGADYVEGMPRRIRLVYQHPDGTSITRDYLSVATKTGKTRSRGKSR